MTYVRQHEVIDDLDKNSFSEALRVKAQLE